MKTLAIQGHTTRGREVIKILEMLGGQNISDIKGNGPYLYYIDDNNFIGLKTQYQTNFIIFTLEQFIEKYPYKVGDKVLLDNQVKIIKGVGWDSKNYEVIYTLETSINGVKTQYQVFNYDLQPYNTMLDITIDGEKLIAPNGYTVKTATMDGNNLIVEYIKNKPQYPKTFQECYSLKYNGQINLNIGCDILHGAYSEELECLQSLLICRDAYWKIAGEERGLSEPWKPDLTNVKQNKYAITNVCNKIQFELYGTYNGVLVFPTKEMCDAFYENFKDLIEKCKEFL